LRSDFFSSARTRRVRSGRIVGVDRGEFRRRRPVAGVSGAGTTQRNRRWGSFQLRLGATANANFCGQHPVNSSGKAWPKFHFHCYAREGHAQSPALPPAPGKSLMVCRAKNRHRFPISGRMWRRRCFWTKQECRKMLRRPMRWRCFSGRGPARKACFRFFPRRRCGRPRSAAAPLSLLIHGRQLISVTRDRAKNPTPRLFCAPASGQPARAASCFSGRSKTIFLFFSVFKKQNLIPRRVWNVLRVPLARQLFVRRRVTGMPLPKKGEET